MMGLAIRPTRAANTGIGSSLILSISVSISLIFSFWNGTKGLGAGSVTGSVTTRAPPSGVRSYLILALSGLGFASGAGAVSRSMAALDKAARAVEAIAVSISLRKSPVGSARRLIQYFE